MSQADASRAASEEQAATERAALERRAEKALSEAAAIARKEKENAEKALIREHSKALRATDKLLTAAYKRISNLMKEKETLGGSADAMEAKLQDELEAALSERDAAYSARDAAFDERNEAVEGANACVDTYVSAKEELKATKAKLQAMEVKRPPPTPPRPICLLLAFPR